jgi:uncharacterized membrane protein
MLIMAMVEEKEGVGMIHNLALWWFMRWVQSKKYLVNDNDVIKNKIEYKYNGSLKMD